MMWALRERFPLHLIAQRIYVHLSEARSENFIRATFSICPRPGDCLSSRCGEAKRAALGVACAEARHGAARPLPDVLMAG